MVTSKLLVKLKSISKIGLCSSSRNMNDIQATPATSGINRDEKSFKETVKKILSEKNDEEELSFNIIRNIAREEFKIYESNIKVLINSNLNKTTERWDKLSSEIVDLITSLVFTQKVDEEQPGKKRIKKLKIEVKVIEDDRLSADEVSAKLIELEDISWSKNLRIDAINKEPNKTWEAYERKT